MARPVKEYEIFSGRIYIESAKKLNELHKDTKIDKTAIVEKAIDMFYDHYKKTGRIN